MSISSEVVDSYLKANPFIAILRGIKPDEILAHAEVIIKAGWRCLEVPLNSPDPLNSIGQLARHYTKSDILIGAGTVTTVDDVKKIADVGGRLIVAPNTNPAVITAAIAEGLIVMPGFLTPTEAFTAYAAGARHLKLFPAESVAPGYIQSIRTVLPADARIIAVGGVTPDNLASFQTTGAAGFGIGSQLYKAGRPVEDVAIRAQKFTANWRAAF